MILHLLADATTGPDSSLAGTALAAAVMLMILFGGVAVVAWKDRQFGRRRGIR